MDGLGWTFRYQFKISDGLGLVSSNHNNQIQNLIVPVTSRTTINSKRKQTLPNESSIAPTTHTGGIEFCWLTQEDIIRFLLNSIALFSQPNIFRQLSRNHRF
ncbi:hypothetical protein HanHA300_Chr17g0672831 [Helianthus annuus]|nr:hypothetical protein HanHA300_Chr17g0672831 [Helianthus annuus]KAJ0634076.1 hypothetical protein HanLR1_Chr17g0684091 [Helianthus annuus]